jgi:hypothetical protein
MVSMTVGNWFDGQALEENTSIQTRMWSIIYVKVMAGVNFRDACSWAVWIGPTLRINGLEDKDRSPDL